MATAALLEPAGAEADDRDWKAEFLACGVDFPYFVHNFCVIDDAQNVSGPGTGRAPFHLWPAQAHVGWALMQHRLLIILKARQLGISWLVVAYVLWMCLFRQNQIALLFSKGQGEANELLRRVKVLYERLPEEFRELLPSPKGDSKREFSLDNGSVIKSMPATKSSGVSYTASIVVMDEAARTVHASELYVAVKPTIDAGGQLIVFSSAYGIGNFFATLWEKAEAGKNGFKAIFLPWWSRPDRTREWYDRVKSEAEDPKKIPQEYPANANEAFVSSGQNRFDHQWIRAQEPNLLDPIPASHVPPQLRDLPGLRLYGPLPRQGEKFYIFADSSEGIDDGYGETDSSAAHVIVERPGYPLEQRAVLHGIWEPDTFAEFLMKLAAVFSWPADRPGNQPETPWIVVERNATGHAVLAKLKSSRYRRIACGHDGRRLGWLTNEVTREPSIVQVAAHLRDNAIVIHDRQTLTEMRTLITNNRGVSKAPKGKHDDLVFSLAIGLAWLNDGKAQRERGRGTVTDNPFDGYRG